MTAIFDQKKSIIAVSVLLFISLLTYITHAFVATSYSSTSIVDADYLSNEQTFFDVLTNDDATPACQPTRQVIEISESLPSPPQEIMDKINANLLEDRVLIVATANYGMRHYVYNWIESLKKTGEHKFLIFCFDEQLYKHLGRAGYGDQASLIPEIWIHEQVQSDFKTYFTEDYRVITHAKTLVVQQLLYLDINVFFSDVDIVWLRPRMVEYVHTLMQIREETQAIFQQEGMNQQEVNSGFYLMKPTLEMKKLLAETIRIQDTVEGKTQQGALNAALNHLNMDLRTSAVVLLDVLHFPNGFVYYDNDLPNRHGVEPYIVHANYLVGEDKKNKLVESHMWYLNDTWLEQVDKQLEEDTSSPS